MVKIFKNWEIHTLNFQHPGEIDTNRGWNIGNHLNEPGK